MRLLSTRPCIEAGGGAPGERGPDRGDNGGFRLRPGRRPRHTAIELASARVELPSFAIVDDTPTNITVATRRIGKDHLWCTRSSSSIHYWF